MAGKENEKKVPTFELVTLKDKQVLSRRERTLQAVCVCIFLHLLG